jgi:septal ring factor EnvC (AmiA/AmiB activator)
MIRHQPERGRQARALVGWSVATVTGLLILTAAVAPAAAAEAPDWPCQQRMLPEIGPGAVWAGPSIGALAPAGNVDPTLQHLAAELAARRTPLEQAQAKVDDFANGLPAGQKNERLTRLFAETLTIINHDLGSINGGLKRYARGQQALADRITASNQRLTQLASDQVQERDALSAQRDWDLRIYRDRRSSLSSLCQQPDLLGKRAFTLGRAIAAHLEQK